MVCINSSMHVLFATFTLPLDSVAARGEKKKEQVLYRVIFEKEEKIEKN